MIGYVFGLLVEHVIGPQEAEDRGERRAFLDPDEIPLDVSAQSLEVMATRTFPIGFEIGSGVELRHTIALGLDVQHGDASEARRLRDLIVLDLCMRATLAAGEIMAADADPETGQSVSRVRWEVDYRPLYQEASASAVVTFTIDVDLDATVLFYATSHDGGSLEALRDIGVDEDSVPYLNG